MTFFARRRFGCYRGAPETPADMLPEIGYVPSGVVEVMRKQQQGWAYIRS